MDNSKDKIDNEETCNCGCGCDSEEKDSNCGCENCGQDGCSEEDCKECDCRGEHCEPGVEENNDSVGANSASPNEKDELTIANEKIKDWEDKYKRLLAEFDNFRKRSEKESAMMIDIGASMILTKILPVADNFERAINSIPEDIKDNAFVDGVDKIYKQMLKTFEELGELENVLKELKNIDKYFAPLLVE